MPHWEHRTIGFGRGTYILALSSGTSDNILKEKITELGFEIVYMNGTGKSFSVVGQAFCNAIILMFDLEHVKNIFNFLSGKKIDNIGKSIIYTIYKSPLILLSIILIPIINILFLILDKILGSPRDTIGYFVIARKTLH